MGFGSGSLKDSLLLGRDGQIVQRKSSECGRTQWLAGFTLPGAQTTVRLHSLPWVSEFLPKLRILNPLPKAETIEDIGFTCGSETLAL